MRTRIGFVEDDDVLLENYSELLEEEGYAVIAATSSQEALEKFGKETVDLMILDVSLGKEHDAGYLLCAEFRRQQPELPIIFLTSHDSEIDHVSGLRVGADDYLSKGTSFQFLLVRIQTLLRRLAALQASAAAADDKPLRIDEKGLTVYWKGDRVDLPLTQYWILRELVCSQAVCDWQRLMQAANITVEPNTIAAHVKNIRNRFRSIDAGFSCIRTERAKGYRWAC